MSSPDKTEVIEDIKRVATLRGTDMLSRSEYLSHGDYSEYQLYDGGYSWSQLCELAGISCDITNEPVSDEEYFQRLSKAVEDLGRYPKAAERKIFGLNFSKSRFSNLSSFIEEAIELGYVPDLKIKANSADLEKLRQAKESFPLLANFSQQSQESARSTPPIPLITSRRKWERTGLGGFPYAPKDESGVVALFAVLCSSGAIPWQILDLNGGKGIDAVCFDEQSNKEIQVELKYLLSKAGWNHKFEDIDYVVCWENRWPNFPKPVIELSGFLRKT